MYTHGHSVYTPGKALTGQEQVSFPKRSLASLKALLSFCLEPPLYRGVAYHSAAKCEIITAKFHLSQFKTFETATKLLQYTVCHNSHYVSGSTVVLSM